MVAAMLGATLLLPVCSSSAFAGWSAAQSFGASRYEHAREAVAVDARGDVAVAWATRGNPESGPPRYRTSVHVAVRTANGRLLTRTVWSSHAETNSLAVAIGAGEVTVVWGSTSRAARDAITTPVRAAYGPLIGHWRAPRIIGRESEPSAFEPANWHPNLAVAPDGEVLLAWNTS
jgi:hypothetical protein